MTPGTIASPALPHARATPGRPAWRCEPSGRLASAAGLVFALGVLAGCQFGGARAGTQDRQAVAACRTEADRSYLQQNRVLLSERSQRDTPFSSSGTVGITSEGLPQLYGRSSDFEACLRSHHAASAGAQPAASSAMSPQMDPSAQP
jgi:hypothetical protein